MSQRDKLRSIIRGKCISDAAADAAEAAVMDWHRAAVAAEFRGAAQEYRNGSITVVAEVGVEFWLEALARRIEEQS